MLDIVVSGGMIVDGTGSPPYPGEVGILDGKIVAIRQWKASPEKAAQQGSDRSSTLGDARTTIDATGLVVSPGFIDVHGHSDYSIVADPRGDSKVWQGVTTEIFGNCGFSAAPLQGAFAAQETEAMQRDYQVTPTWKSIREYLRFLDRAPLGMNVATLVGHGNLRGSVMGYESRPPKREEMKAMKELLRESLEGGALGMSTGLIYSPSSFSTTEEIVSLARVLKEHDALYTSHIRGESETLFQALDEALTIGREAGVRLQISHLKCAGASRGRGKEVIQKLNLAAAEGVGVDADQYPYEASCTGLSAILPQWVMEGGERAAVERLKDPASRKRIRKEISLHSVDSWGKILISSIPQRRALEGLTVEEIAKKLRKEPLEAALDLLVEAGPVQALSGVEAIYFSMIPSDVEIIAQWPRTFVASDASARAPNGKLSRGKPHPRSYGTFPRAIQRFVRDRKLLPLEAAVAKMTSLPAEKFSLKGRGQISEGSWADLVIFDERSIEDRATYQAPHCFPGGIAAVIVNGKVVIDHGRHTGQMSGRVLTR